jgi:hypothetical protein
MFLVCTGCGDDDPIPSDSSPSLLSGVVILDFEGAEGFIVPSDAPINGLTGDDLAATADSGVAAIRDEDGTTTGLNVPLEVNPGGPSLFVSLGDDAGELTTVSLSITDLGGQGFIGQGEGNGDDSFDGVAATSVAADFLEIAPWASVTFTYSGLPTDQLFTIASFSSNVASDIGPENAGAATVDGTTTPFLPGALSDAGIGTLFSFPNVAPNDDGTLAVTFEATDLGPTFVSGFFISGSFTPSP